MGRLKTVLTTKLVLSIFVIIVVSGTTIWFVGWMLYDILGLWRLFTPSAYEDWLLAIYKNWLLAILAVCTGYLVYRYVRREEIYEESQKLVRKKIRGEITEEVFEKRLKKIKEKADVATSTYIEEILPHIIAFEQSMVFVDEHKKKKK